MSYTIKNYDGTTRAIIEPGTIDVTSASIEFIGRGLKDWGEPTQQNLYYVLQNFANIESPPNPTTGQLWYDTRPQEMRLKVYDGVAWVPSGKIQSSNEPPNENEGTLWFDSLDKQLKVKIADLWEVVGPLGSKIHNDPTDPATPVNSVIDAIRISDSHGDFHDAFRISVGGVIVAIVSKDPEYLTASPEFQSAGFPKIYQGITVAAIDSFTVAGDPFFWTGRRDALPAADRSMNVGSKLKRIGNVITHGMQISGNLHSTGTTYLGPSTNTTKPIVFAKTSNLSSVTPRAGAIEFDGSSFYFTNIVEGSPTRQVPLFTQNLSLSRRLYVSMSGSDEASGNTPAAAKKTLKAALDICEAGDTVFIESGDYIEQNPLYVPPYVSVIGDNLRRTIIRPAHNQLDLFHVNVGTYFYGMTFKGHRWPSHTHAFPCSMAKATITGEQITAVTWMYSMTGYTEPPVITVESPKSSGSRAVITPGPLVNGGIVDIVVTNGGEGYSGLILPTVTVVGYGNSGSGAIFKARIDLDATSLNYGKVVAVDVLDPGEGYEDPVTVNIFGGGATVDATAVAIIGNGILRTFNIVQPGLGYKHPPLISIQPPPPLPNITSSPYVQNCSSITGPFDINGRQIFKAPGITGNTLTGWVTATNPGAPYALLDVKGAGAGLRVDGDVLSPDSVLRSFVCDSFTQVNQGGIGHLLINRGYAQFVSCFTTFSSVGYWARAGGFCNISNSVVDFGDVGIQAEGYYWEPYEYGVLAQDYSSGIGAVNINVGDGGYGYQPGSTFPVTFIPQDANGTGAVGQAYVDINKTVIRVRMTSVGLGYTTRPEIDWSAGDDFRDPSVSEANFVRPTGVAVLASPTTIRFQSTSVDHAEPQNASIARINGSFYTITAASKAIVGGVLHWDINVFPGFSAGQQGNDVTIHDVSNISTGGLALEYVGSGVTYNALPRYGGIPDVSKQVVDQDSAGALGANLLPGRVYYVTIDNTGNFKIGKFFGVNFLDGTIKLNYNSIQISGITGIGPFARNGIPVGVAADEISDDPLMTHPGNPLYDHSTIPTQHAVRHYLEQVSTNIIPDVTETRDLGTESLHFNEGWIDVVNAITLHGAISFAQVFDAAGGKPVVQEFETYSIILGWDGNLMSLKINDVDYTSGWPIRIGGEFYDMRLRSLGVGVPFTGTPGEILSLSLDVNDGLLNVADTAVSIGGTLEVDNTSIFHASPKIWPKLTTNASDIWFYTGDNTLRQKIGITSNGATGYIWSSSANGYIASWDNATKIFTCEGNFRSKGDVTAFYGQPSDIRLKNNITNLDNALDKVSKLNGVRFDWNDSYIEQIQKESDFVVQKHDVGVIAQEVEAVLPEVVIERDDGTKTVKYEKIIPLLIEAIKDLKAEVESLKQQKSKE